MPRYSERRKRRERRQHLHTSTASPLLPHALLSPVSAYLSPSTRTHARTMTATVASCCARIVRDDWIARSSPPLSCPSSTSFTPSFAFHFPGLCTPDLDLHCWSSLSRAPHPPDRCVHARGASSIVVIYRSALLLRSTPPPSSPPPHCSQSFSLYSSRLSILASYVTLFFHSSPSTRSLPGTRTLTPFPSFSHSVRNASISS